jgi:TM2 domain-containing membrane protein YozV
VQVIGAGDRCRSSVQVIGLGPAGHASAARRIDMASGTGRGSAGNVIAAICSFFIPGLGQLVQGRLLAAAVMLILTGVVWVITLGLLGVVMHIVAAFEAAVWKGPR